MATSPLIPHPGNFDLQQRNQNKNPPLAAKPAQQEDGVVEERWSEENNEASLSLAPDGCVVTAQSFLFVRNKRALLRLPDTGGFSW